MLEDIKMKKDEYDRYMSEASKYIYNTNVFKNVKLAIEEVDIQKDEELIIEVSRFLKEKAIEKLI
jgi:hypothetical protein